MSRQELVRQLLDLGVQPGTVLLVHAAFSRVRPVDGGPAGLISAIREALGADGTLVMPSMSYWLRRIGRIRHLAGVPSPGKIP